MYAIISTGGKQYRVEPGQVFETERLAGAPGDVVTLDGSVVFLRNGEDIKVGTPAVEGASVALEIVEHIRGKKLIVFKMKRRKRHRRKQGHRQELTRVLVKDIGLDGVSLVGDVAAEASDAAPQPEADAAAQAEPVAEAAATEPAAETPEAAATEESKPKAAAKKAKTKAAAEKAEETADAADANSEPETQGDEDAATDGDE